MTKRPDNVWPAVAFVVGLLALVLLGWVVAAHAHEGDDALSQWYRSLMIPGTQTGCCSEADCRPVPYHILPDGYEVEINGVWMKVPPAAIINLLNNPTGEAVACYLPSRGIMCFVRPSEA